MSIEASILLDLQDCQIDATNFLGFGESSIKYDLTSKFADVSEDELPQSHVISPRIGFSCEQIFYQHQMLSQDFEEEMSPRKKSEIRRQNSSPIFCVPDIFTISDTEFKTICEDKDVKFNVTDLKLIPVNKDIWVNDEWTFGDLVTDYFRRKNATWCKFYQKLYNALRITDDDPFYFEFLGVQWIDDNIIKVDKKKFGRLLGLKNPDSLFHQQGYFPSNGFVEINEIKARKKIMLEQLEDVDFKNIVLIIHQYSVFHRNSKEEELDNYKWECARRK